MICSNRRRHRPDRQCGGHCGAAGRDPIRRQGFTPWDSIAPVVLGRRGGPYPFVTVDRDPRPRNWGHEHGTHRHRHAGVRRRHGRPHGRPPHGHPKTAAVVAVAAVAAARSPREAMVGHPHGYGRGHPRARPGSHRTVPSPNSHDGRAADSRTIRDTRNIPGCRPAPCNSRRRRRARIPTRRRPDSQHSRQDPARPERPKTEGA